MIDIGIFGKHVMMRMFLIGLSHLTYFKTVILDALILIPDTPYEASRIRYVKCQAKLGKRVKTRKLLLKNLRFDLLIISFKSKKEPVTFCYSW